jgi:hypothetical protein
MSEKEYYKKLLIDKSKKIETLVSKAKDVLGIDNETGEPIILVSRAKLTDENYIALYMIGRFVACELELTKSPSAVYTEIAKKSGISKEIVAARLSGMKKKGYVRQTGSKEWEIIFPRIGEILDEIRQKLGLQ